MKKKFISLILGFTIALTPIISFASVGVNIDGIPLKFDTATGIPFIDSVGRTQVPLRETIEKYGCQVKWDQASQIAIVSKNNTTVNVPINQNYIKVNDKTIKIDTAAMLKDNRVFLPIRPVVEAFGSDIAWGNSTSTVKLSADTKSSEIKVSRE